MSFLNLRLIFVPPCDRRTSAGYKVLSGLQANAYKESIRWLLRFGVKSDCRRSKAIGVQISADLESIQLGGALPRRRYLPPFGKKTIYQNAASTQGDRSPKQDIK